MGEGLAADRQRLRTLCHAGVHELSRWRAYVPVHLYMVLVRLLYMYPSTPAPAGDFSRASLELKILSPDLAKRVPKVAPSPAKKRRFLPALSEPLFDKLVSLPGKSWAVYLIVLQRSRMERTNPVALTTSRLKQSGISRMDKLRALAALEKSGLISVERRPRKNPLVTLLEEKLRP